MDAERERQIAQAAEQLAQAVYGFLSSCTAAATSLNQALVAAQAGWWLLRGRAECMQECAAYTISFSRALGMAQNSLHRGQLDETRASIITRSLHSRGCF